MITQAIDIILHLNLYLGAIVDQYHYWVYGLIFIILFCETGLVITPFLPGDSLLFAAGAIFASSRLNIHLLVAICLIAVFLGDNSNYWIGRWLSPKIFSNRHNKWFKQQHFDKAHQFYEHYGVYAIIIARFLPLIRTFMPFVAGVSKMTYKKFIFISILAAILWVCLLLYAGYFLGSIPIVQSNFSIIVVAIIIVSLLPAAYSILFHFYKKRKGC